MLKLKIMSIVITIALLTGCGKSDILTCTNNEKSNGLELNESVKIAFVGKNATNVEMNVDIKAIEDDSKKTWDDLIDFYTRRFPITSEEGLTVDVNNNSDNYQYSINMMIDLNKVTDEILTKYGLEDLLYNKDSLEDIKLEAEQNGFSCKIITESN